MQELDSSLRLGDVPASADSASVAVSERRAEALRTIFPKLASWCETERERAHRREVEACLFEAMDIAELERRIHRLRSHAHAPRRSDAIQNIYGGFADASDSCA